MSMIVDTVLVSSGEMRRFLGNLGHDILPEDDSSVINPNFSTKARFCCCSIKEERLAAPLTRLFIALTSSPHKRSCLN